jgi:hypothetical protein
MSYFKKIVTKWSQKIGKLGPNSKNKHHIFHLENVLLEEGWTWDAINEFVALLEAKPSDSEVEKRKKDKIKYKKKTKDGTKEIEIQAGTASDDPEHEAHDQAHQYVYGEKPEDKDDTQTASPMDFDRKLGSDKKVAPKPKSSEIYKDIKPGQLMKGGDSDIKQTGLKYGYKEKKGVFKPAPGNAGSMLNEIISGEVAQILEQNPELTDKELIDLLQKQFGNTALFKQNKDSKKTAAGISVKQIPEGENRGLYSKLMIAAASGRRKHNKSKREAKQNGFKNPKMENYYGHSESFEAMVNDIKGKNVIGPDGTPIDFDEAENLIRTGGGGDNPSDTGTLTFDSDSDRVIMTFHSDKDSTEAIIAQSSAKAEANANQDNVQKLVDSKLLEPEQAEAIMGENQEYVEQQADIERELKQVSSSPAKWFQENVTLKDALKSIFNDTNQDGSVDKDKTSTKWGPPKSTAVKGASGPNKNLLKYLVNREDPSDEELLEAFLSYMADEDKDKDPTDDQIALMDRLNRRWANKGAPDVDPMIEDIRNRTISNESDFIKRQDAIKINYGGKEIGVGTFLEANTIFKQFHLEAMNPESEKGVHKHKGMFETNHGGLSVDGEVLRKCIPGVNNKEDFVTKFEVGDAIEQKGVSGSQKGRTTGSKRIVYAINEKNERVEVGTKVARTKSGKLGKLQTVYQWSDQMKKCFSKDGKRG